MAEFAIFDKSLQRRARRSSVAAARSRSLPRTDAVVTYDQYPERSKRQSVTQVVQLEDSGRTSDPKLALVRHKAETDKFVQETRYDDGRGERIAAFAQAAAILFYRLRKATSFCEDFETSFRYETQHLRYWSSRKTLDMLWRAKTDWDGVPYEEPENDSHDDGVGRSEHYNKHVVLVRQAWEELKYAQSGSRADLKNVVRELRATMQQIEELWELVRADRMRMRSLIHRLKDGMAALNDIEDLWNRPEYDRSDYDRREYSRSERESRHSSR